VKEYLTEIILGAVILAVFLYMWRKGTLARLRTYVLETREELRKCTWPTMGELKGSTVVVMVTVLLLGGFTVVIDVVIAMVVRWMTLAA